MIVPKPPSSSHKIPMFQIFWSPGAKRRAGVREPAGTTVAAVAAVAAAAGPKETPSPRENSKAPKEKAKDQSLGWIWSLLSWKSFIPSRKINVKWSKGSPFLGRFYCWAYPIKCWCSCVLLIVWWEKWSKWMMSWPSRWHLKLITAGERLHAFS